MADIALAFTDLGGGDLVMSGADLGRDDGLESAVLVSLFTDRRADPDQLRPGDDATDLRGWWGDVLPEVEGDRTGSLLWLLAREKQTRETLARGRHYASQALAWMVDDKLATRVEVQTEYVATGVMLIGADVYRPDGSRVAFRYNYEWAAQAAKRAS